MGRKRNKKRLERVKQDIPIVTLLADYGYLVHREGGDREQQFPCDLHGDGMDSKPSARVYPQSNTWYCFGCGQARDVVQTVRDKEDLGFLDAISYLERRYHLPPLPWEDEDEQQDSVDRIDFLSEDKTFEDVSRRFQRLLETSTQERVLPMRSTLSYWEGFDRLIYHVQQQQIKESIAKKAMEKMRIRLREAIEEEHALG